MYPFLSFMQTLLLTVLIIVSLGYHSCTNQSTASDATSTDEFAAGIADSLDVTMTSESDHPGANNNNEAAGSTPVSLKTGTYDPSFLSEDSLKMESIYVDMLAPIADLKTSDPKTYWFIVSWLNTAYRTPNWDNYENYPTWRLLAKKKGVDCSGFARVMQDRVFGRQIRGGSQGILDTQCKRVSRSELAYGDLVFFRAPYSKNDRIVHVGVYLKDGLFVHATSTKSAAEGLGLMINSLDEENWAAEYVTGGRIIEN